ncbi:unnamed protein product [Vitrella brassicaformis CCMP3155]|uniref:Uncharacterized protein n=2 Tax=Vitrella brassicaformis TaxID=1169539 RepID=A0A0G4EB35_VITBC|nr:unnamed protein product [Vitrella brassicaformis CCMP3155]|eukprot:CEL93164.1 unnamed protein product [Vitrella brassicaformis CCMP3155]
MVRLGPPPNRLSSHRFSLVFTAICSFFLTLALDLFEHVCVALSNRRSVDNLRDLSSPDRAAFVAPAALRRFGGSRRRVSGHRRARWRMDDDCDVFLLPLDEKQRTEHLRSLSSVRASDLLLASSLLNDQKRLLLRASPSSTASPPHSTMFDPMDEEEAQYASEGRHDTTPRMVSVSPHSRTASSPIPLPSDPDPAGPSSRAFRERLEESWQAQSHPSSAPPLPPTPSDWRTELERQLERERIAREERARAVLEEQLERDRRREQGRAQRLLHIMERDKCSAEEAIRRLEAIEKAEAEAQQRTELPLPTQHRDDDDDIDVLDDEDEEDQPSDISIATMVSTAVTEIETPTQPSSRPHMPPEASVLSAAAAAHEMDKKRRKKEHVERGSVNMTADLSDFTSRHVFEDDDSVRLLNGTLVDREVLEKLKEKDDFLREWERLRDSKGLRSLESWAELVNTTVDYLKVIIPEVMQIRALLPPQEASKKSRRSMIQKEREEWNLLRSSRRLRRVEDSIKQVELTLGRPPTRVEWGTAMGFITADAREDGYDKRLKEQLDYMNKELKRLEDDEAVVIGWFHDLVKRLATQAASKPHTNLGFMDFMTGGLEAVQKAIREVPLEKIEMGNLRQHVYMAIKNAHLAQATEFRQQQHHGVPAHYFTLAKKARDYERDVKNEQGRVPNHAETAKALDVSPQLLSKVRSETRKMRDMMQDVKFKSDDGTPERLHETLDLDPDNPGGPQKYLAEERRFLHMVEHLMTQSSLTDMEYRVMHMRLGVSRTDRRVHSAEDVRNELAITPRELADIEANAFYKMRKQETEDALGEVEPQVRAQASFDPEMMLAVLSEVSHIQRLSEQLITRGGFRNTRDLDPSLDEKAHIHAAALLLNQSNKPAAIAARRKLMEARGHKPLRAQQQPTPPPVPPRTPTAHQTPPPRPQPKLFAPIPVEPARAARQEEPLLAKVKRERAEKKGGGKKAAKRSTMTSGRKRTKAI